MAVLYRAPTAQGRARKRNTLASSTNHETREKNRRRQSRSIGGGSLPPAPAQPVPRHAAGLTSVPAGAAPSGCPASGVSALLLGVACTRLTAAQAASTDG